MWILNPLENTDLKTICFQIRKFLFFMTASQERHEWFIRLQCRRLCADKSSWYLQKLIHQEWQIVSEEVHDYYEGLFPSLGPILTGHIKIITNILDVSAVIKRDSALQQKKVCVHILKPKNGTTFFKINPK